MKKKYQTWNNALTKFIQDVLIGFVPLILHFRIFDRTYNWNHYRRIRVNIISLRLENWFFWWRGDGRGERRGHKTLKFGDLGLKFLKTNFLKKISNFTTGYRRNFLKIKKLTSFDPKSLDWDSSAQHFWKRTSDLKSAPS